MRLRDQAAGGQARQQRDARGGVPAADFLHPFKAIDIRHGDIGEHQIRLMLFGERDQFETVFAFSHNHDPVHLLKNMAQAFANYGMIINKNYSHFHY